jgi:arabinose-5-phosphate isomerase
MGDALAVAMLEARGFTEKDFAHSHPGGSLGRRLLLHVEDLMHKGDDVPRVHVDTPLRAGLLEMTKKKLGMTVVVDDHERILGVFTDGDLRRLLDKGTVDVRKTSMSEVMVANPKRITPRELAAEAVYLMEKYAITALPVADPDGKLVGALNIHDHFRAGVV